MIKRSRKHSLGLAVGMAVVLGWAGQSFGVADAPVTSPTEGTATVSRYDVNAKGQKTFNVTYTCLHEDGFLRYEDAAVGLGEDNAVQTDHFVIQVDRGREWVEVTLKAAGAEQTLPVSASNPIVAFDDVGFDVELVTFNPGTGTMYIDVTSRSTTPAALSHCDFTIASEPLADDSFD